MNISNEQYTRGFAIAQHSISCLALTHQLTFPGTDLNVFKRGVLTFKEFKKYFSNEKNDPNYVMYKAMSIVRDSPLWDNLIWRTKDYYDIRDRQILYNINNYLKPIWKNYEP